MNIRDLIKHPAVKSLLSFADEASAAAVMSVKAAYADQKRMDWICANPLPMQALLDGMCGAESVRALIDEKMRSEGSATE